MPRHPHHSTIGQWVLAVLAWLWLLLACPFLTDVACNIFVGLFLFGAWVLLAIAWLVVGLQRSLRGPAWWLAGLAGGLGVNLACTDAGLAARVALSRPWLEAYTQQVPQDSGDFLHEPRRVGLFQVDGTENKGGAIFLYTSSDFLDRHGLVYLPPGQETRDFAGIRTRPLLGFWHTFCWHF